MLTEQTFRMLTILIVSPRNRSRGDWLPFRFFSFCYMNQQKPATFRCETEKLTELIDMFISQKWLRWFETTQDGELYVASSWYVKYPIGP